LRSLAHISGTVCQSPFEPQRSRLWRSLEISSPTCLTGTDSASEDYLGRALQICASSSSSSSSSSSWSPKRHCFYDENSTVSLYHSPCRHALQPFDAVSQFSAIWRRIGRNGQGGMGSWARRVGVYRRFITRALNTRRSDPIAPIKT